MSMMSLLTSMFVLFGAALMAAAIIQSRRIKGLVPPDLKLRWRILITLMGVFLIGYLLLVIVLLNRLTLPTELITVPVFLGGALFVFIVTNLTRDTISRIRSAERDLKVLNESLEQRVAERTCDLQQSHNFLRTILNSLNDEVLIIDAQTHTVRDVNKSFLARYGLTQEESIGKPCYVVTHNKMTACTPPDDICPLLETIAHGTFAKAEHIHYDTNGKRHYVEVSTSPITEPDGSMKQVVHVSRDISALRESEETLKYMAHYDALTGLPNRSLFFERLKQDIASAKRDRYVLAILYIDLDRFKTVNDTLGHDIGDLLLKEVAKRLTTLSRETDTFARVGGDEFIGLCGKISTPKDAAIVAERIIQSLGRPYRVRDNDCSIGVSIGISLYPEDGDDMDLLLSRADATMYNVKEKRNGGYMFYRDMKSDPHSQTKYFSPT